MSTIVPSLQTNFPDSSGSPQIQVRNNPTRLSWDEIGRRETVALAGTSQSQVLPSKSAVPAYFDRRFVWRSPLELHPHPNLQRYGAAASIVERNGIAKADHATFQEAIEITTQGTILDGLPQWQSAANAERVLCIEYPLTDEQALVWLLDRHGRGRKEWNKYCRILTALELESKFKKQALENQIAGGQRKDLSNLTKDQEMHVRSKLAELAHVCPAYIDYVKQLQNGADSEIQQALESGEVSIHWAWTLVGYSKAEQRSILENRRIDKAISLNRSRTPKRQRKPVAQIRAQEILRLLGGVNARDIILSVLPVSGKRVVISEELLTTMQSQSQLELR